MHICCVCEFACMLVHNYLMFLTIQGRDRFLINSPTQVCLNMTCTCRAEINIKPWKHLLNDLKEGNKRMRWMAREPYAYWKGNPSVALIRQELMKCNVSDNQDWNARVYAQVTF